MEKFVELYSKGVPGHVIVGHVNGTVSVISEEQFKDQEWVELHTDDSMRIIRASSRTGMTIYPTDGLAHEHLGPDWTIEELIIEHEGRHLKITFRHRYIQRDNAWIVDPEIPSIETLPS